MTSNVCGLGCVSSLAVLYSQNLLLDECGIIKLSDFGVSRVLSDTVDVAQSLIGTPNYMYEAFGRLRIASENMLMH